jgi:hypothetical protein
MQPPFHWWEPSLPCMFGETGAGWNGPHLCHRCAAEVDAAVEWMRQARLRGEYDEAGYTPNERKAQRKRAA